MGGGRVRIEPGYTVSTAQGNHRSTLTGEEGGGRFLCPHAVFIDRRGGKTPELYVADRENSRVQVYDLDGQYLRTFGDGFLNSPSGFAVWEDMLVIAELYSRLAVVDAADSFIGYVGATGQCPNRGRLARAARVAECPEQRSGVSSGRIRRLRMSSTLHTHWLWMQMATSTSRNGSSVAATRNS